MLQALCKLQALLGYSSMSAFPAGFASPDRVLGHQGSAAGVSVSVDGSLHFWCLVFVFQGGAALAAHGGVCPQPPTEGTWVFSQASCSGLSSTEPWKRWSQVEVKSSL